jgi:hypothetical protein
VPVIPIPPILAEFQPKSTELEFVQKLADETGKFLADLSQLHGHFRQNSTTFGRKIWPIFERNPTLRILAEIRPKLAKKVLLCEFS